MARLVALAAAASAVALAIAPVTADANPAGPPHRGASTASHGRAPHGRPSPRHAPHGRPHQPQPTAPPCSGSDCLLPFPNNADTVADRASRTGRRVAITAAEMPANVQGVHIDPTEWDRQDGFSPGEPILVQVPGLDTVASGIPDDTDVGASLRRDAPILLINTRTGRRTPYFAELDAHAADDPARQLLIIRPAVALTESATYAVVLRNLKDADGQPLSAPAASPGPVPRYVTGADLGPLQRTVRAAGVSPRSVYEAWTFTVASEYDLTSRAVSMRDQAFAQLGRRTPAYQITSVTAGDSQIARRITGTFEVPSFLTGDGGPGTRLHYGPAGGDGTAPSMYALPTPTGTYTADFVCNIPNSATSTQPATLSLYGHGLLGSPTEINASDVEQMSQDQDFAFCATSWIGLAAADVPNAAQTFADLSSFPSIPDRLQQSFVNFLFLGRLMDRAAGFASDPAFQDAEGHPLIDVRGGLHYDGNSQGGINGGALGALAQDYTRVVLGVPGMDYSLLLQRSVDFAPFQQIMDTTYPDPIDQQLDLALIQMLWDRGEADGYAQHLTHDPLPGTPAKTVLMDVAFGDHQVANVGSEMEARTLGVRLREPVIDPGWSTEKVPFWGIAPVHLPFRGSALEVWNSQQTPAAPDTNLAPSVGTDPHEFPRSQPAAQVQKAVFLRTGTVIDVCGGAPCD